MASYKIEWKESALKELRGVPKEYIEKIVKKVRLLENQPFPTGSRKLTGVEHTYRLRVGDFRVIYSVYKNYLLIEIIRIAHRKDVYR